MQQDRWEDLGNERSPRINEIGKNLQEIAGNNGYLDATSLGALCSNMGANDKAKNNRITFSIRGVEFGQNSKLNRTPLQDGSTQVQIPNGDACAEHAVYRDLFDKLRQGMHLTINQSKAPCSGCLNKLQGLARLHQINIVVHYDEAYDVLNKPNGNVFISTTGKISWQH